MLRAMRLVVDTGLHATARTGPDPGDQLMLSTTAAWGNRCDRRS
jgi:uncharacterized protein (DUF885 family)